MCWYWFPINNFGRDALILLKVCRRIYHCKLQVKSIIVIIRKILAELWPFFYLVFGVVLLLVFHSINFAGKHWFYWKFAEGYIIVKYRSSSIVLIFCKILGKLWPFFDLVAFRDRSDYKDQWFFSFFISNGWRFKQATHPFLRILVFRVNKKKQWHFM